MNRNAFLLPVLGSLLVLGSTACTAPVAYNPCERRVQSGECYQEASNQPADTDLILSSQQAINALLANAQPTLHPANLLWVTSVADINDLENSTPLGRLLGEQLGAALAQRGYVVMEPKTNNDLTVIPYTGEFIMSRHMRHVGQQQNVGATLAGTYAVANKQVYVTLKLLSMAHGRVMSAYAYSLPMGGEVQALLARDRDSWWW